MYVQPNYLTMKTNKFNRRKFLRNTSLTAIGAGVAGKLSYASNAPEKVPEIHKIKDYRQFGKTGFKVSDISSGNPSNENVLRTLLDRGVNLIDTGEVYANGNSEKLIGEVTKDLDRDKLFIVSKLYAEKEFPSKEDVIDRTNKSLERLQTDYLDCMMIHSAESSKIIKDEAFHAGMEQLKKDGKVRHVGVSCHGNNWAYDAEENLEQVLMTAVEDGRFDVLLLAYNFVNADIAEKVLNACEQKNIATMIMKSNPVYIFGLLEDRIAEMTEEGKEVDEYTQAFYDRYKIMQESAAGYFREYGITGEKEILEAASKFVLSNPNAHTTLWDFRNFDDVELMLNLSGQKLTRDEAQLLEGYHKYMGQYTCRIGCNDCETVCPHRMPVNKILRYNYYFSAKRRQKYAMSKFARLKSKNPSEVCTDCEGYCEQACKYGVSTRYLLANAQNNLKLNV